MSLLGVWLCGRCGKIGQLVPVGDLTHSGHRATGGGAGA